MVEVTRYISICRDPRDDKFIELAIAGQAKCIVTGDKDLLNLHPFGELAILTPRQFLEFSIAGAG
jgi:predicted nucleic acid-binding protein